LRGKKTIQKGKSGLPSPFTFNPRHHLSSPRKGEPWPNNMKNQEEPKPLKAPSKKKRESSPDGKNCPSHPGEIQGRESARRRGRTCFALCACSARRVHFKATAGAIFLSLHRFGAARGTRIAPKRTLSRIQKRSGRIRRGAPPPCAACEKNHGLRRHTHRENAL